MKFRRAVSLVIVFAAFSAFQTGNAQTAAAASRWAPAESAPIHPGVQTRTPAGQCTANFVFTDRRDVYLGQAAHCSSRGSATDTNGCTTGVLPLGTRVNVEGASEPATIVYNSWVTMQKTDESNGAACAANDFALVRLSRIDRKRVNPSVPFWGGPKGLDSATPFGEVVYSYGDSGLRAGLSPLSPKTGAATGEGRSGWTHNIYTATPGVPGDSGSAVLGSNGGGVGVLVTLELDGSNGATDLTKALAYMKANTRLDAIKLVNGTEPFSGLG